ncbi:hypothetical protein FHT01_001370 [Sphingomonas japonica]|uniref:Uncharacterized protein n=1 Tax=Sphingomonas japonica TaxID=511662 RepID=A0ABX0TZU0_9SPHN|nr:hypothetical protein [Sphingomonas japonica]
MPVSASGCRAFAGAAPGSNTPASSSEKSGAPAKPAGARIAPGATLDSNAVISVIR